MTRKRLDSRWIRREFGVVKNLENAMGMPESAPSGISPILPEYSGLFRGIAGGHAPPASPVVPGRPPAMTKSSDKTADKVLEPRIPAFQRRAAMSEPNPDSDAEDTAAEAEAEGTPTPSDAAAPPVVATAPDQEPASMPAVRRGLSTLPKYSQSLLKIQVSVSVQLAAKKELVQEVITLAPGSIIKFDKGCEELLQMIVGEHTIAEGEAVKIGDKFGFRVTSMLMPREHFVPVRKRVGSRQ